MAAANVALFGAHLFSELVTQPISAELKPRGIALAQRAMYLDPLILPDVGTIIELSNRQMLDPETVNGLLRNHGVTLWPMKPGEHGGEYYRSARAAWNQAVNLKREVPSTGHYVDWLMRGRISPVQGFRGIIRAGGNPDHWFPHLDRMRERPGIGEVTDAIRRGLITPEEGTPWLLQAGAHVADTLSTLYWARERPGIADVIDGLVRDRLTPAQAEKLATEAGTSLDLWLPVVRQRAVMPGIVELIDLTRRGFMQPFEMDQVLGYHGVMEQRYRDGYLELLKGLPGVADLVTMGLRESFNPELAQVYNNYGEFPEKIRPWFAKLGLDYPMGFQIIADGVQRDATLADLYWGMHWHAMPLGSAYLAYQRFQPDLVDRFREDNPNLKSFGLDDLKLHMKWADLPPGVRDWMVALSHPQLGQRVLQSAIPLLGWDRAEVQARYRLLGYGSSDAAVLARLAEAKQAKADAAWAVSIETAAKKRTVSEIEGMYDDGIIDRPTALQHLAAAGLSDGLSAQLLDLSDAARARALVRAAVKATGADYLSGALSAAEATSALADLGIKSARAGELMQIWTIRRSRHRRQASTGQILGWVGAGRMTADEGRRRLSNLQWSDPDQLLLLADAQARLDKLHAGEEKLKEKDAASRAKEIARLAKEAKAEERRLLAEANRVAPRSVLITWLRDHVIDEPTFRDLMAGRGYPKEDIDRYVTDANTPKPPRPKVIPAAHAFPRPPGSAHETVSLLRRWAKDGVIDRAQFLAGLRDLGYGPSDIDRFDRDQYPPAGP